MSEHFLMILLAHGNLRACEPRMVIQLICRGPQGGIDVQTATDEVNAFG